MNYNMNRKYSRNCLNYNSSRSSQSINDNVENAPFLFLNGNNMNPRRDIDEMDYGQNDYQMKYEDEIIDLTGDDMGTAPKKRRSTTASQILKKKTRARRSELPIPKTEIEMIADKLFSECECEFYDNLNRLTEGFIESLLINCERDKLEPVCKKLRYLASKKINDNKSALSRRENAVIDIVERNRFNSPCDLKRYYHQFRINELNDDDRAVLNSFEVAEKELFDKLNSFEVKGCNELIDYIDVFEII